VSPTQRIRSPSDSSTYLAPAVGLTDGRLVRHSFASLAEVGSYSPEARRVGTPDAPEPCGDDHHGRIPKINMGGDLGRDAGRRIERRVSKMCLDRWRRRCDAGRSFRGPQSSGRLSMVASQRGRSGGLAPHIGLANNCPHAVPRLDRVACECGRRRRWNSGRRVLSSTEDPAADGVTAVIGDTSPFAIAPLTLLRI
jgi:hypothetical protein